MPLFKSRWFYLRLLGCVYFLAFWSLHGQILGLVGSEGILPASHFLDAARSVASGVSRIFLVPSVFWINSSDAALLGVCSLGMLLSLGVIAGLCPALCLLGTWVLYLSIFHVGQTFLSFQWDILLLEAGFVSIFFAPWTLLDTFKNREPVSRIGLWLLRLLLFKLMFESFLVKILSGDPTWRDLTALSYHYMTQPIPNPLSWYFYHLPLWFHKCSAALVFFIEGFVPFLIFCGRPGRLTAFVLLNALQFLITLTGNFCFFNVLTVTLSVTLLDDRMLEFHRLKNPSREKSHSKKSAPNLPTKIRRWIQAGILIVLSALIGIITLTQVVPGGIRRKAIPPPALALTKGVQPFFIANHYGLFAMMTLTRPEIIIEGSNDGVHWQKYEFLYKTGNLSRRPPQIAPFQPRLDWQMWFAALSGDCRRVPWFVALEARLLEDSPPVTALLKTNPFPDAPPRYIRAQLYDYDFTSRSEHRSTGRWWKRRYLRPFCPALSKKMD